MIGITKCIFYIQISDIQTEVILPVNKADTRYFPLIPHHDGWAIVSEVQLEYGTTKINIHGVVTVRKRLFKLNLT